LARTVQVAAEDGSTEQEKTSAQIAMTGMEHVRGRRASPERDSRGGCRHMIFLCVGNPTSTA